MACSGEGGTGPVGKMGEYPVRMMRGAGLLKLIMPCCLCVAQHTRPVPGNPKLEYLLQYVHLLYTRSIAGVLCATHVIKNRPIP